MAFGQTHAYKTVASGIGPASLAGDIAFSYYAVPAEPTRVARPEAVGLERTKEKISDWRKKLLQSAIAVAILRVEWLFSCGPGGACAEPMLTRLNRGADESSRRAVRVASYG